MKVAYFDCMFGAAGDMLLGAFISAGLPVDRWKSELKKIALPAGSFDVEIQDVQRCSIAAKKLDVLCSSRQADAHSHEHADGTTHSHSHEHVHADGTTHSHSHSHEPGTEQTHAGGTTHLHSHDDAHDHEHEHAGGTTHSHSHDQRNLSEIFRIIDASQISDRAKKLAKAIFQRLGEAEAKVHGMPIDEVHFHEVGAIDAIVDIVGFAIAYDMLNIEKGVVSAVAVGSGRVKTQHGLFPVPAPAVVNLLRDAGIPISASPFQHECLTPTAAAILAEVCDTFGSMPSMTITAAGYGAGTYNPASFPNVCRVVLGEANSTVSSDSNHSESHNFASEIVAVLETNIDDMSPQILAFAMERLFEAGALDVSIAPVVMKKSRSGHLLSTVCKPGDRIALQELILTHTSSLGVRSYLCERLVVGREWHEVELEYGERVRIKVGRDLQGNIVNAQPEYEDCAQYATKHGRSLKDVIAEALTHLNSKA